MKKMQGIIDPISLTLALVLGIAAVATVTTPEADDRQMGQNTTKETIAANPATDKVVADN